MSDIFACDAFAGLDDIITDWALEQLNDDDSYVVGANVAVSRQFFAWLLGLSEPVSIVYPPEVNEEMKSFVESIKCQ